jgi:transcription initiation factor TFIID subunit 4
MGGVNLAEESQRILGPTELIGTQIRSVKDEAFFPPISLQGKVQQVRKFFVVIIKVR